MTRHPLAEEIVQCPVCLCQDGYQCVRLPYGNYDATLFDCDVCGKFAVSGTAIDDYLDNQMMKLTKVKRAALSHQIKSNAKLGHKPRMLTTYDLQLAVDNPASLPSPAQQAANIIRFIGGHVTDEGAAIESIPPDFGAIIGSPSREFAFDILSELKKLGFVTAMFPSDLNAFHAQEVTLTLAGWDKYESEKHGELSGNYGFLALKTGDPFLDPLVKNHIKPSIEAIGFKLVDYRDIAQAGIIDNILRVQIRDAAFVLVDLTHENAGAYWEAGYAEGLGKPVLYICEKNKFEEKKTHFDTNHCTTVQWDIDQVDDFLANLIATLKRSLKI
jgi:hypothetical protein